MKNVWPFFFLLFIFPSLAFSTLGENSRNIEKVQKTFSTKTHTIKTHGLFTVHELTREGLTLREYSSLDGVVFGVTWNGLAHPDLDMLLGSHLSDYHRALKSTSQINRRKFSTINGNDIIVEKAGHMRSVHGRAYIPSLLPSGMNPDEIK